mgnify:CR=1 FL=1
MMSDNASKSVINATAEQSKHYGIFIQNVYATSEGLRVDLNDPNMRVGRENASGNDIKFEIDIYWTNTSNGRIMEKESQWCMLDYSKNTSVNVPLINKYSDLILAEVRFDGIAMYSNYIDLKTEELV